MKPKNADIKIKTTYRKKYCQPDSIEIREIPFPVPKDDELLVQIKASTVNRTDEGVLLGKPKVFRLFVGFPQPRLTATGTDFSGVVIDTGKAVSGFKKGDEIYGFHDLGLGTHSEYVCISVHKPILHKPSNISHEEAAASLEGAHYAYFFLNKISLPKNCRVMVNGATGAIGNAVVQLLIERGARVTFTYPTDSYDKIKHLKAEHMIDYLKEDFTQQDRLFDFVLDAVGKSSFAACKRIMKPHAAYISSELGPQGENIPLSLLGFFKKGKRVIFPFPGHPKKSMTAIKPLLENKTFQPLIDCVYPFAKIRHAYRYMLTGQKRGNIIIAINDKV
ncbi:MAG: NAD(P)-dependent alcohol dehydrogenase [Niabella sp.]